MGGERRRRSATGRWSSPPGYCDEADADAGGPPGEILAFVAWGRDLELREVFDLVRSKLEEIAEEGDEDASD
jgi:hypothetical protein